MVPGVKDRSGTLVRDEGNQVVQVRGPGFTLFHHASPLFFPLQHPELKGLEDEILQFLHPQQMASRRNHCNSHW